MNPTTTETNGRLPKKFVLLTVSAVMIITLGVTLWVSFRVMKAEAHVRYVGISNLAAEKIAMTVRGMEMNAKNVFDEVAKHMGTPDAVVTALECKTSLNPEVKGYFAAFELDYFQQKGHWFEPYVHHMDSSVFMVSQVGSARHDYTKSNWYIRAKEQKESFWSDPYYYQDNDEIGLSGHYCTFVKPVFDKKGQLACVCGADITLAGCTPSSTYAWLNINNARVRVNAGGDMWWDLPGGSGAKYYIPANGSATSLYAGSLWIAGMDVNNQLKCAAIRFRQEGNDFWTGPLTVDGTASIDAATCMEYDKMYNITRAEVDDFLQNCDDNGIPVAGYEIPANIMNWPAHGDPSRGMSYYLAPFYDRDNDGTYDPTQGDYPYYDITNELCHTQTPTMEEIYAGTVYGSILSDQVIKGDQTIWWVFNDKGNSHTETGGSAIGMEIRAQAFAFSTNDEINNMTFYSYEIINRSTYTLTNTYFSPWTDVDLGYAKDDYVGCDVSRGLGYGYNGSAIDGSGQTEAYGANPPAVGVDFFQGPYLDPDGLDNPKYDSLGHQLCDESINGVNFGNGIIDDERFGMRRFVYHDNTGSSVNGDPDVAAEYYLLLRGIWKNGAKMQYGGTAVPGAAGTVGPACDFMFPYDSDPCNWGTGGHAPGGGFNTNGFYWSEETGDNGNPNPVNDRRFMQSAGPFTLKAGAVNYITFGVPWARATTGKAWASVELLRKVDDKCQSMFDNCFKVLDGPNAPDLTIRELDRQLIIYLSNSESSNNPNEDYAELDPNIPEYKIEGNDTIFFDRYFRFEGYQIYQLADAEVSVDQLTDESKARLIYQCDIKNGVSRIINFIFSEDLGFSIPTLMVEGGDNGISHSFVVTQDQFTKNNDPSLVNHHTYYFMAIAYAYNNYLTYDPETTEGEGQKLPYLAGRKNIKLYSAVPHKIVNGTVINSSYGDQPVINRWTGIGNGGNRIEIADADIETLLQRPIASSSNKFGNPDYPVIYHPNFKRGYGPVNVKIIDPLNVKPTDYAIWPMIYWY